MVELYRIYFKYQKKRKKLFESLHTKPNGRTLEDCLKYIDDLFGLAQQMDNTLNMSPVLIVEKEKDGEKKWVI